MAVNTQKLLPVAKGSPLAKISSTKVTKGILINTKKIDTQKLLGPVKKEDSTQDTKNTLLKIDSFLNSILNEEKKNEVKRKKEEERKDFEEQEKKLEAPKEVKKFKLPGLNIPKMSFLDRIKRFLFFTALGWLFTKFQDQLPKLEGIVKTIAQVYVVAEGIFKSLLGGLVNFIDIGYQTYDGLRKQVENIGGKDAAKTFDEFSGHLNKLINGAIAVSLLIASTGPGITPKTPKGTGAGYQAGFAAGYAAGLASRGKGPRYRPQGQAAAGRTLGENVQRQALTRQRMLEPTGPKGPLDRISRGVKGAAAQLETGTLFKKGSGIQKAVYNAPGKIKNVIPKTPNFIKRAGGFPVIGPLVVFGVRTLVYGEKPQKAAAAAIGTGIGEVLGGVLGSAAAGGLGLATGGLGLLVSGLLVQGGRMLGGLAGEWLGAALYDFVSGLGNKDKPQPKAAGGPVTRGGRSQGAVSRTLKITRRRPPKIKPKQSQPGKDVGGKKNIQKLYPDPSANVAIEGEQKSPWFSLLPSLPKDATPQQKSDRDAKLKSLPNPYKALTGVAKKLKDIPFGIGALMGGAVDIALGEKLPRNAIDNLGNGIAYLINAIATQQVSASVSGIEKEIAKMQSGGVVPRLRDFSKQDQVGSDVTKVLNGLIRQKVDEAIKEVQKQMMPGKYSEGGATPGTTPPGTTPPGTTPPGTTPTGKGLNQPNVSGKSGYQGSTNVVDTGLKDYKGRPIKLNPGASQAFKQMIADGMPFKSGDVTNVYRDEAEYLRLIREGYSPAANGSHNYGEGADIHGSMGEWIKKNGKKYGWYYVDYPGTHGGHFEWKGTVDTPTKKQVKKSGEASWYGPGFDGNRTANGEIFDMNKLTAASPTLPFGTKVTVTNKANGKSVVVTINDRGPFEPDKVTPHRTRVIDLSKGAMDKLGGLGSGVIDVDLSYQGGGYIPKQSPKNKTSSLSMYPSYSEGGMMIAIQPMIIEKPVPMPMGGNKTIMFPVAVGVNNSMNLSNLSQG